MSRHGGASGVRFWVHAVLEPDAVFVGQCRGGEVFACFVAKRRDGKDVCNAIDIDKGRAAGIAKTRRTIVDGVEDGATGDVVRCFRRRFGADDNRRWTMRFCGALAVFSRSVGARFVVAVSDISDRGFVLRCERNDVRIGGYRIGNEWRRVDIGVDFDDGNVVNASFGVISGMNLNVADGIELRFGGIGRALNAVLCNDFYGIFLTEIVERECVARRNAVRGGEQFMRIDEDGRAINGGFFASFYGNPHDRAVGIVGVGRAVSNGLRGYCDHFSIEFIVG